MRDYMLRGHLRFMASLDEPCPTCGHREGHREYPSTWKTNDDGTELIEVPHPKYKPLLFACTADGCECEIQKS